MKLVKQNKNKTDWK